MRSTSAGEMKKSELSISYKHKGNSKNDYELDKNNCKQICSAPMHLLVLLYLANRCKEFTITRITFILNSIDERKNLKLTPQEQSFESCHQKK